MINSIEQKTYPQTISKLDMRQDDNKQANPIFNTKRMTEILPLPSRPPIIQLFFQTNSNHQ